MRTVPYRNVLNGLAALIGVELAATDRVVVNGWIEHIYQRIKQGWDYYRWPELCVVERFTYYPDWTAGPVLPMGYDEGDKVFYGGSYWVATDDTESTDVPGVSDKWAAWEGFRKVILFQEAAAGESGVLSVGGYSTLMPSTLIGVYSSDPRLVRHAQAAEVPFYLMDDGGADLGPDAPNEVWVWYKRTPLWFSGTVLDEAASYGYRDQFYHPGGGNFYQMTYVPPEVGPPQYSYPVSGATILNATFEQFAELATKLEFPYFLETYVKQAAYADWLTQQENPRLAAVWEAKALGALDEEIRKLAGQQRQLPTVSVRTRGPAVW